MVEGERVLLCSVCPILFCVRLPCLYAHVSPSIFFWGLSCSPVPFHPYLLIVASWLSLSSVIFLHDEPSLRASSYRLYLIYHLLFIINRCFPVPSRPLLLFRRADRAAAMAPPIRDMQFSTLASLHRDSVMRCPQLYPVAVAFAFTSSEKLSDTSRRFDLCSSD